MPAHVRNDPHLIYEGYEKHIERLRASPQGTSRRILFETLLNQQAIRPPLSIFTPTSDARAPAPIARLIDTDLFLGGNFEVLGLPQIGIAEYANGNFLSDDTIFSDFALPDRAGLGADFFEPEGQRFRRYFEKVAEGESIRHFVAESTLYEPVNAELGRPMDEALTLTRRVYEDYAAKLLPRAVGYSAALLDYFFRGRLDVDVVEDPVDPSVLRLEGTNASGDPLVDGTLTLYADDPTGARSPAVALDPTTVAGVAPGEALSSARFQTPENAERFVAVYQGTLGNEARDPARNFPGGVIGKVLGGVRVEELFSDGTRWNLRTPQGVFPLPILRSQVVELKWGDADNTLVGRSHFGRRLSNQFFAWEIARPPGSLEVPLLTEPDGSRMVDVRLRQQVSFPFGMDLGTTIEFNQTIHYEQYLLSFVVTETFTFGPFGYQPTRLDASDGRIDLMVNETQSIARNYQITLDPDRFFLPSTGVYRWNLEDIALTADGRILALVVVSLMSPGESATFPAFTLTVFRTEVRNDDGNLLPQVEATNPVTVPFSFPSGLDPAFWTLVDVTTGRVVASTAPPVLAINHHTAHTNLHNIPNAPAVRLFSKERFIGGNLDGAFRYRSFLASDNVFPAPFCSPDDRAQARELGQVSIQRGTLEAEVRPYRSEITSVQFPASLPRSQSTGQLVFLCGTPVGPTAFAVTTTRSFFSPGRLDQAFRTRPGSSPEQLVLLLAQSGDEGRFGRDQGKLVLWTPELGSAEVRHELLERGFHTILSVSRSSAMLLSDIFSTFELSTSLIPLVGSQAPIVFPDEDLGFSFTLLEPGFLYNAQDLKFYRLQPPLQRTALPAKLADVPDNPAGDYHAVRLP